MLLWCGSWSVFLQSLVRVEVYLAYADLGRDEDHSFFCAGLEYSSYCLKVFCFIGFPVPSPLLKISFWLGVGKDFLTLPIGIC